MNLTDTAEKIKTYDDLSYGGVLADEGIVADLSYSVNRLRRNADLKITDRVRLFIYSGEIVSWAVYWNKSQLLKTTLSEEIFVNDVSLGNTSVSLNYSPGDILIPEDASLAKEVGTSIGGTQCDFPVYLRIEKI